VNRVLVPGIGYLLWTYSPLPRCLVYRANSSSLMNLASGLQDLRTFFPTPID
jgi:hypothetical protein